MSIDLVDEPGDWTDPDWTTLAAFGRVLLWVGVTLWGVLTVLGIVWFFVSAVLAVVGVR